VFLSSLVYRTAKFDSVCWKNCYERAYLFQFSWVNRNYPKKNVKEEDCFENDLLTEDWMYFVLSYFLVCFRDESSDSQACNWYGYSYPKKQEPDLFDWNENWKKT
jgi:hypothetical protein